jgi:hypothetical protein
LLAIEEAHAWGSGGAGGPVLPDPELSARLRTELGDEARAATVASLDTLHGGGAPAPVNAGDAADMQTAALFGRGRELEVAIAAVLIVTEAANGRRLADEVAGSVAKQAGLAASAVLST